MSDASAQKASDLFVRALEAEGVEYIFAVPGEENPDFVQYANSHGATGHRIEG